MSRVETENRLMAPVGNTLLVFTVVQIIQDSILTPRIMGKVTGFSPATILLSVSVWGKLLVVFGLIIILPIKCLLLAYYRRIIEPEKEELATQEKLFLLHRIKNLVLIFFL